MRGLRCEPWNSSLFGSCGRGRLLLLELPPPTPLGGGSGFLEKKMFKERCLSSDPCAAARAFVADSVSS